MSSNGKIPDKLSEEYMADLLEMYLNELETDPQALPPKGLDPQAVEAVKKMNTHLDAPEPSQEFVATLRGHLDRAAAQQAKVEEKKTRGGFSLARWSWVGAAAALVIALVAIGAWATRPAPVDAAYVLTRARDATSDLASVGVQTFEIESISEQPLLGEPQQTTADIVTMTTKMWYGDETHWRVETSDATSNARVQPNVQVRDGDTTWNYDAFNNLVMADSTAPRNPANAFDTMAMSAPAVPLPNFGSMDVLTEEVSNCWTPRVVGEEKIAGRDAYKIDLGTNKCASAALPIFEGAMRTLWVDKETFFVLRDRYVGKDGVQNLGTYEVLDVKYNVPIDPAELSFTPPAGSMVNDNRPKPAPTEEEFIAQARQLGQEAGVQVYVPIVLPSGLVPRVPKLDPLEGMVSLEYTTPEEAGTNSPADMGGIIIRQAPATDERVEMWTMGTEPAEISRYRTWILRGDYDAATNMGGISGVYLIIDDTLVSVQSFTIDTEELLKVALSLQPLAAK
jgi:outer membrane lipoprotein-sorting protein